jgi:hypothetical protein
MKRHFCDPPRPQHGYPPATEISTTLTHCSSRSRFELRIVRAVIRLNGLEVLKEDVRIITSWWRIRVGKTRGDRHCKCERRAHHKQKDPGKRLL